MIFTICDHLRERIAELNDKVVEKFKGIIAAEEAKKVEDSTPKIFEAGEALSFTPVTKETFSKWCEAFLEELK